MITQRVDVLVRVEQSALAPAGGGALAGRTTAAVLSAVAVVSVRLLCVVFRAVWMLCGYALQGIGTAMVEAGRGCDCD